MGKKIDFFLGANSPQGFASYFDELSDINRGYRSYIIKGGPGSGKSSMMKHTIPVLENDNTLIERIHCSSDPNSLDGVIFYDSKISIVDGTAPHAWSTITHSKAGSYLKWQLPAL